MAASRIGRGISPEDLRRTLQSEVCAAPAWSNPYDLVRRSDGGLGEPQVVAAAPDTLTLKTNRDRRNWWQSQWLRRGLLLIPAALVALGLANVFGQRPASASVSSPVARLTLSAPTHVRSGLIYAARFRVDAVQELRQASLLLDQGWADGYTVNGEAPQPLTQGSSDGRLNYGLGHVAAGSHVILWLSLQVNPTTIGHHAQTVRLYDGKKLLLVLRRSVFIFP